MAASRLAVSVQLFPGRAASPAPASPAAVRTSEASFRTVRKGRNMLRALGIGLLVIFAGTMTAPAVRASDEAPAKTYAVIVGISDYADAQIKPRKTAETDAK